jgi:hypothetical protein
LRGKGAEGKPESTEGENLDWWRQMANAAMSTENPNSVQKSAPVFATIKDTATGRAMAARIEASDTYLPHSHSKFTFRNINRL